MRTIFFLILYLYLFSTVVFADNLSNEFSKFEQNDKATKKFEYKSKPKTSYHNKDSEQDNLGLERLKPVLEQMAGKNKDGTTTGVVPNATMSF